MTNFEKVKEFHEKFDVTIGDFKKPTLQDIELRINLIKEEFDEVLEAMGYDMYWDSYNYDGSQQDVYFSDSHELSPNLNNDPHPKKMANVAKELVDLLYVVYGTAIAFGIDADKIFSAVHESNMSKLGLDGKPVRREDGKVLKGPNYKKPDVESILYDSR